MPAEPKTSEAFVRPSINGNEIVHSYLNKTSSVTRLHVRFAAPLAFVLIFLFLPSLPFMFFRYVHASPPWAKQLQADLPSGTTVVTFTAWSPVSNYTSTCRIVIRVRGKSSRREIKSKKYPLWEAERKMDLFCALFFSRAKYHRGVIRTAIVNNTNERTVETSSNILYPTIFLS